jgi:hypothetical protein
MYANCIPHLMNLLPSAAPSQHSQKNQGRNATSRDVDQVDSVDTKEKNSTHSILSLHVKIDDTYLHTYARLRKIS